MGQYKTQKVISKKYVHYEGSDTLKAGYLLCYNYDSTTGLDGDTIAEGKGCNARFLGVEKPSTNNAKFFAGVVSQDFDGFVGPGWIEIIEPVAGQIYPVFANVNCTNGTTLLYVSNGSYLANSSGQVCLGLAEETVNRSGTNGLVLCRMGYVSTSSAISDAVVAVVSDVASALSNTASLKSDDTVKATKETSDVASLKSDDVIQATKEASDVASLKSDDTVKSTKELSDIASLVSNEVVEATKAASDVTGLKSDIASGASNAEFMLDSDEKALSDGTVAASNGAVVGSNSVFATSNLLVKDISNAKAAISNAKLAAVAGDYVNESDIKVTLAEVLKAFSDALNG